jgi:hypothetical protein
MKSKFAFKPNYLLILSCMLLLAACHKYIDWDDVWHKHNPNCRIEKITWYPEFGPDTITGTFSYNSKGNPDSVIMSHANTATPHHLFRYDNKGRLTDLIAPYLHNDAYEYWVQYNYDNKGRVVSDMHHTFGDYVNGEPLPSTFLTTTGVYEYDAWDRVVKIVRTYPPFTGNLVITDTYEYNLEGNMTRHQNLTQNGLQFEEVFNDNDYDDKVSMWRTNRLWMFIDRNYSKNNARPASTYNAKGLPSKWDLPQFTSWRFLHSFDMQRSEIVYKCK